jgi:Protein of unknown function (DUF402)
VAWPGPPPRGSSCAGPDCKAAYAVWHGEGPDLDGWYVNLQEPFRRTARGIDTMDSVLDIVVARDGAWRWKDAEELDDWQRRPDPAWPMPELPEDWDVG